MYQNQLTYPPNISHKNFLIRQFESSKMSVKFAILRTPEE